MTKSEIIKCVREGTEFSGHLKNFNEDLKNVNELMREGALTHNSYGCDCPFPTNTPNISFTSKYFSLVDGFDYAEYES